MNNLPVVEYKIVYSQRHEFLYHPDFHPERKGMVAQIGWRAIVQASANGMTGGCDACLGLNKQSVEEIARDMAYADLMRKLYP
jgi:hypothetical protein